MTIARLPNRLSDWPTRPACCAGRRAGAGSRLGNPGVLLMQQIIPWNECVLVEQRRMTLSGQASAISI